MNMHARTILTTSLAAGFLSLAGCETINNERLEVGDREGNLAFTPVALSSAPPLQEATGPSVRGIERPDWPLVAVPVPVDEVSHHPTFTWDQPRFADQTARQRGEHPNAASALTPTVDQEEQYLEAALAPIYAGLDVVLFVPRNFVYWMFSDDEGALEHYERVPEGFNRWPAVNPADMDVVE